MSDLDFKPLVIRKPSDRTSTVKTQTGLNGTYAHRAGAVVGTEKKSTSLNKVPATDHQRIAKLDRENEVKPPAKVSPSVGKAIQAARMEKELSQKDLAQKINEKPSVLQDYESGKAIPNPQVLGKLERVLGVKLRGADIGKKLNTLKSHN